MIEQECDDCGKPVSAHQLSRDVCGKIVFAPQRTNCPHCEGYGSIILLYGIEIDCPSCDGRGE